MYYTCSVLSLTHCFQSSAVGLPCNSLASVLRCHWLLSETFLTVPFVWLPLLDYAVDSLPDSRRLQESVINGTLLKLTDLGWLLAIVMFSISVRKLILLTFNLKKTFTILFSFTCQNWRRNFFTILILITNSHLQCIIYIELLSKTWLTIYY